MKLTTIGDCIVDLYPQESQTFLGGTAYNLALRAKQAGAQVSLISQVGTDSWGKQYLASCRQHHINSRYLHQTSGSTSQVTITLDKHRSPRFSAWKLGVLASFNKLTPKHQSFLSNQAAACSVAIKPLKSLLKSFCQLQLPQTLKVADFDGTTPYTFSFTDILTYSPGLDLIVKNTTNPKHLKFLKNLAHDQNKLVLVMQANQGSQLFTPDKTYSQPAIKTTVKDTTGAGDTYLATFIVHYLKTQHIPQAMSKAATAAAKKLTRLGASS